MLPYHFVAFTLSANFFLEAFCVAPDEKLKIDSALSALRIQVPVTALAHFSDPMTISSSSKAAADAALAKATTLNLIPSRAQTSASSSLATTRRRRASAVPSRMADFVMTIVPLPSVSIPINVVASRLASADDDIIDDSDVDEALQLVETVKQKTKRAKTVPQTPTTRETVVTTRSGMTIRLRITIDEAAKVDILDAIEWIARAWASVSAATIRHCWIHSKILPQSHVDELKRMDCTKQDFESGLKNAIQALKLFIT